MVSTDREQFDGQLAVLCAAYDRPIADRAAAYWQGLAKMHINEFIRVVDWCCGERAPDKLPTPKACWTVLRSLKSNAMQLPQIHKPPRRDAPDNLAFLANRLLLAHLSARHGLGSTMRFIPGGKSDSYKASQELGAALKFKNQIVVEFAGYVREGDELATRGEFIRQFVVGLDRVSKLTNESMTKIKAVMAEEHEAPDKPMDREFVEGVDPNGQFDFSEYADA